MPVSFSFSSFIVLSGLLLVFSSSLYAQTDSNHVQTRPQNVVVSIEPYALLLRSFKREQDQVNVLLEKGFSEHSFHLKPTHLKQLAEADVFIWGGAQLEPHLIEVAKKAKKQVVLAEQQGLTLLHGQHTHAHAHDTHIDPHIWLSESNSRVLAKAMATALFYADDVVMQKMPLSQVEQATQNKSLIVFHDAYAYMENDLNIQKAFAFSDVHEKKAGLKQWQQFQMLLEQHKKTGRGMCLLGTRGFEQSAEAKKVMSLLEKNAMTNQVSWLTIDPLAHDKPYADYADFLKQNQNRLKACVN